MGRKYMSREKLILWLGDAIDYELEKPEEEIDLELVEECSKLLDELMGTRFALSEEELAGKFTEITGIAPPKPPETKHTPPLRRMLTAVCVVVFVMASIATVCAFQPTVRNMVMNVLKLGEGASVADGGVTYVHDGKSKVYSDIEELISAEELEITLPYELPNGITIEQIIVAENEIFVVFNRTDVYMTIYMDANIDLFSITEFAEIYEISGLQSYFSYNGSKVTSHTPVGSAVYYVGAPTQDIVVNILENIAGRK